MGVMDIWRQLRIATVAVMLMSSACINGDGTGERRSPSADVLPRGGTLRVIIPVGTPSNITAGPALDPQTDYWYDSFELFRCCLARTLLAHRGVPTRDGGSQLHPDLAVEMPTVSSDGLTWTFRLKPELRYGPPLEDMEITSADVIRAVERTAATSSPNTYAFYYSVIEGFDAMASGEEDSISGLEAPDPSTLIVHLTRPAGDLANLFAMPATAPIPPDPTDPSRRLGVAHGHDAYGRFLVSTGPYMIEGSDELDLNVPPEDRIPITGYRPTRSITLIRNPSWNAESDHLRPAYVDRIEITIGGRAPAAARAILEGDADLYLYYGPPPQLPSDLVAELLGGPYMRDQLHVEPRDFVRYITLNLAIRPLDDVHVRRAINLAVDKQALLDLRGGPVVGEVAGHIVLDSLERGLLAAYDPYATPSAHGDFREARQEMRMSRYDADRDGRCDQPACRNVAMLWYPVFPSMREMSENVRRDLAPLGIELNLMKTSLEEAYRLLGDPREKVAMAMFTGWGKDFLNASNFFLPLFSREAIGGSNFSLVGATSADLRRWDYDVTSVPSVDDKIEECVALVGDVQVRCWAEADQLVMERIVPAVPYVFEKLVYVVSDRVVSYSFDQFAATPALDRIAVSRAGPD